MHANEYVVSGFALIILVIFCSPIFALAYCIAEGLSPNTLALQVLTGMTNATVVNSLHSLLLPLVGAVIIFRSDYFVGLFGALVLLVLCLGIFAGFFVFLTTNPAILGSLPRFEPYALDFKGANQSIFQMISMLILLFLAKLGVNVPATPAAKPAAGKKDAAASSAGGAQ